jgi:hypothetical protein
MTLQRIAVGTTGAAQGLLIQHIQRSAIALGEITEEAVAHDEPIVGIQRRC